MHGKVIRPSAYDPRLCEKSTKNEENDMYLNLVQYMPITKESTLIMCSIQNKRASKKLCGYMATNRGA
jgi:hypothetical protein